MKTVFLLALCGCASLVEGRIDSQVAPSPAAQVREPVTAPPPPAPDAELLARLEKGGTVSLAQLIDFALRTSPTTRATWFDARGAAAGLGSKRSAYYPQIELDGNLGATHQTLGLTGLKFDYKNWGPSAQLSWLLLDFGSRGADVDEARAVLAAANLAHDMAVQDLVLRVEQAYTQYQGAKALLAAQKVSVAEAQTAYAAAEERRKSGVATIADVLQAKTALSQAQLQFQTVDGTVNTLRGAVATAVGVPANVPVEAEDLPPAQVDTQLQKIEVLIGQAERERPELARARAQTAQAQSHAESVRWRGWPQLVLNANAGRNYFIYTGAPTADNYGASLLLRIPLFTGFKDSFDAAQAADQARAAEARAESVEQQVILQVWSSYHGARTAAHRVRTARDLLASAQQSEEVATGRYKEGVGSILDLLTAQAALASARAQEVQARADWLLSLASLAHDTGALGPAPQEKK